MLLGTSLADSLFRGHDRQYFSVFSLPTACSSKWYWRSYVEKPAETHTSIQLACHLVRVPNSWFGGHEFNIVFVSIPITQPIAFLNILIVIPLFSKNFNLKRKWRPKWHFHPVKATLNFANNFFKFRIILIHWKIRLSHYIDKKECWLKHNLSQWVAYF